MLKLRLPMPVFRNAKEIVNGINARMALKGLVANKVAFIVSSTFKSSQYFEQLLRLINAHSVRVIEKSWIGDPALSDLSTTIGELETFQPDYIIALGGGAVIDGAKLSWLFYECPSLEKDLLFRPFSSPPLRGKSKFAVIPTTLGSGSEVSSAAVVLDDQSNCKKAVVTHDFLPDLVILDPELVRDVPLLTLRATIADALSHALEGYVSNISHPIMDTFAEKAVSIIHQSADEIFTDCWSVDLYDRLQHAAMLAGWVQNHKLVGLSHAIAHQLADYPVGHGLANALLMPSVIRFNMKDGLVNKKYQHLCDNAGLDNISQLVLFFEKITKNQNVDFILSDDEIDEISLKALSDPAVKVSPIRITALDIKGIVKESL